FIFFDNLSRKMMELPKELIKETIPIEEYSFIENNQKKLYQINLLELDDKKLDKIPSYIFGINDKQIMYGWQIIEFIKDFNIDKGELRGIKVYL
ncbi:MAG: hypothetical protein ACLUCH_08855, partial [Lachnospirales bacterium]